jgi:hypothetical protein
MTPPVVVIGAGIAGVSCARVVRDAGHAVRVVDRGRRIGGRMAVRTLHGRPVDVGAAYLTAREPAFRSIVDDWCARGLARPWTDTFHLATPAGIVGTTTGPMRYATPGGLRSLVEDLAGSLDVEHPRDVEVVGPGPTVDGEPAAAVALAMPDPQAADLLADGLAAERLLAAGSAWEPVLTLVAGYRARCWPRVDGVFVNDSPVLEFVADDGARRGDGAPVLVAHADPVLAAGHLDDPAAALPALLAELHAVLGIRDQPDWVDVRRWGLARPALMRSDSHHLGRAMVGLAGDGWHGPPRIEAACLSGRALGAEIAERLR